MTINKKIFLLFTCLFMLLLTLIFFILKDRESNALTFENNLVQNRVISLHKMLNIKNLLLNNISYEYSKSEKIIDILTKKETYYDFHEIASNLDISYFIVLDKNKNIKYSEVFDTSSKEYMDITSSIKYFFDDANLDKYVNMKDKIKFTTFEYEKLIFSIEKVEGLGYIFVAKALNSSFLSELSSALDVYVSLLPSYTLNDNYKTVNDFDYDINREELESLYINVKVNDYFDDSFYLFLKMKREIFNEIKQSNRLLLELFFVSFLLFIFIIFVFINKIFTSRIEKISKTVKAVSQKKDLVQNIELIYDDEITYLTKKMNEMFKTIHNSQTETIKKERDFLQSVLDSQQHIIFITDGSEIHSANKKFLELFQNSNSFMNNIAILDNKTKLNLLKIAQKHSSIDKPAKFTVNNSEEKYFVFDISRVELRKYIVCMNDVSNYNKKIKELENKASIDELTSCYNKSSITNYCKYWLDIKEFGLIIVDIDKFKNVNDTYGHFIGDCILKDVASLLKAHLQSDDLIGRFGGEEFIIAVNTSVENLSKIANRLRSMIEQKNFNYEKLNLRITASFGCTYCTKGKSFEEYFKIADEALYLAKNSGRNKVMKK
ncbi:diguanylate cyclase [Malaciobacter sp. WC5094]|uniref:sensor domain-containing diguanylate cyclase n=1 Tax=Arcobacter sp. YIC-80 TaxID=3376683 RepID=UPI00384EA1D3